MEIKKYISAFKSMELNKTTEDVEADIKHLQFGTKLKYYGYYFAVAVVGIGIYSSLISNIKEDPFRATLIKELNVAPLFSYFYSDYSSELEKANAYKDLITKKINELQKQQIHSKGFSYKYDDFLNDVRANQSSLEFSIILNEQVSKYMEAYFLAFLQQNKDKTITLGSNEYNFIDISKRVQTLDKSEALEKLKIPAQMILDKYLEDISKKEENLKILSNALYSLSNLNYQDANFFNDLKIPATALEELKTYLLKGDSTYSLISNGYKQTIKLPKLDTYFEKEYTIKKSEYEKNISSFEEKQKAILENISNLQIEQDKVSLLIYSINKLKSDIKNYKTNKEDVENKLKEITWKI